MKKERTSNNGKPDALTGLCEGRFWGGWLIRVAAAGDGRCPRFGQHAPKDQIKEHRTSNIQHPTSNIEHPTSNIQYCGSKRSGQWVNNVGCSVLTSFSFTPCKARAWLIEPMTDAVEFAAERAAILPSPARSSIDGFQKARKCGEKLYSRAESISWGERFASPNINGEMTGNSNQKMSSSGKYNFSLRGFLREKHEANNPKKFNLITERTPQRESK